MSIASTIKLTGAQTPAEEPVPQARPTVAAAAAPPAGPAPARAAAPIVDLAQEELIPHLPLPPLTKPTLYPFQEVVPPSITSVQPGIAAAGQEVTIHGSGFGANQGNAYLAFSDSAVNWGAPGDLAAFEIVSWSNTAITFMVPVPSGPDDEWAVQPESSATIYVAVPTFQPDNALHSNMIRLMITAVPAITSISASNAGPGAVITLSGLNFCPQQGDGYVLFADNGVNWGGPTDVASFDVLSWNDTQISFILPTPSGGYAATPGTTATITVTNASGLTSNETQLGVTSGAVFPVTANSGLTNIGSTGDGHMETTVTIEADGSLTAMTHIWDTDNPLGIFGWTTGFHGATVVTIYDSRGNKLDEWSGGPFGVEGGQGYYSQWTATLSATDLACVYSVSVVNFYDPQYSAAGSILKWVEENGPAIASASVAIVGAF
jgi:hypothetical protein